MPRSDHNARLSDVAHAANVSLATASRALAGRDGVRPDVVSRVRDAAAELGYVPNTYARALAGAVPPVVGLIVHDVADPYFAEISRGVLRIADQHNLMVLIHQSERRADLELARIRTLRNFRVGSMVLAGSGYVNAADEAEAASELAAFEAAGGRVAMIGRHHVPVDAVIPDNSSGGQTATRHLLDLGHRKIGVIAGPEALSTIADRLKGVRRAVADVGLPADSVIVEHDEFSREGGIAATARLLDRAPDITSLAALSEVMAMGALEVLRETGRTVPSDVSVVGFDDVTFAADLAPALTTVRLPMSEMGAMALEMTLKAPASRARRRRARHELVVRASTAPALR